MKFLKLLQIAFLESFIMKIVKHTKAGSEKNIPITQFNNSNNSNNYYYHYLRFYLFLEGGEWREKERERNINVREKHQSVASCMCLHQRPNLQPRHMPWLGIELVTFTLQDDTRATEPHQLGLN